MVNRDYSSKAAYMAARRQQRRAMRRRNLLRDAAVFAIVMFLVGTTFKACDHLTPAAGHAVQLEK